MKKVSRTEYADSRLQSESITDTSQDYRYKKKLKKEKDLEPSSTNNVSPESEEKNSDIKETVVYYERILKELKNGLHDDSKEIFCQNVLQESENKEVDLCCHKVSSHCIEVLLPICKDKDIFQRFMDKFAENKETVVTDASASHVTELLIRYNLHNMKNWNPDFTPDESEESKLIMNSISWLSDFADFVHENFSSCLRNVYSCHVANTLIRALGGELTQPKSFMSKSTQSHKKQFYESYVDEGSAEMILYNQPIVLEHVPKYFVKSLKKLSKALRTLPDIEDGITESSVATVIEALLVALKKRLPNHNEKVIIYVAEKIFELKNEDGLPFSLLDKNSSFIVEEMYKAANDDSQHLIWELHIKNFLSKLVVHPIGNYIVQRMFDSTSNTQLFEIMCEPMWDLFDEILNSQRYGIFVSLANACVRLKVQQAQFMQSIMLCLQCADPAERHKWLILLLLGFKKYEGYEETKPSRGMVICLQGSLVCQAIMKFLKPLKASRSLLAFGPQDLLFIACHTQGCHVMHSFFATDNSVGEKSKDKLLDHLRPVYVPMISDRNGSLTLSRIWTVLSIKQKEFLMKEIILNEKKLLHDRNGSIIYKKFGGFHFKNHYHHWKIMQENLLFSYQQKNC